jgi:hypothetical protein
MALEAGAYRIGVTSMLSATTEIRGIGRDKPGSRMGGPPGP